MSYTESGRLSALKETIRICTVNDAINRVRACQKVPYGNSNAANYGTSESGRISALGSVHQPAGICYVNGTNRTPAPICTPATVSATQTIQTQGSRIRKINSDAIACGLEPHISAGGIQESLRLRRLRDEIVADDVATNPNARYQVFNPPICPPAPNANNLPLTRPKFECAPNVIGFTLN